MAMEVQNAAIGARHLRDGHPRRHVDHERLAEIVVRVRRADPEKQSRPTGSTRIDSEEGAQPPLEDQHRGEAQPQDRDQTRDLIRRRIPVRSEALETRQPKPDARHPLGDQEGRKQSEGEADRVAIADEAARSRRRVQGRRGIYAPVLDDLIPKVEVVVLDQGRQIDVVAPPIRDDELELALRRHCEQGEDEEGGGHAAEEHAAAAPE
jgi:hypothetical protein